MLGDETGTTRVVLWDQKAGAVLDTAIGEVLEVIGRHPGKSMNEIYALALRKVELRDHLHRCRNRQPSPTEPVELDAVLLAVEPPRTFTKRDGSTGEMVEAVIGDGTGLPGSLPGCRNCSADSLPGQPSISRMQNPSGRGEGRNYSLDEKSTVTVTGTRFPFRSPRLGR